jgi:hypothetical protein
MTAIGPAEPATALRPGEFDRGASLLITGVLRWVNATIASGKIPKMRITAAEAQTTAFVQRPVLAGSTAFPSRGFMNITITTYR